MADLSGADVREEWTADHPHEDAEIRQAILEGVFVPGMSIEHRDVLSNPNRKDSVGNGYWRTRTTGEETRYQWFVGGQWEPFIDGRGRPVCELVFSSDRLAKIRYCGAAETP